MSQSVDQLMPQAVAHHQAGRLAEAQAAYRQVLLVQPQHADALHLSGVVAGQMGRHQEAVDTITQAIQLKPGMAVYWCNLGKFLQDMDRLAESIEANVAALKLDVGLAQAHNNLGTALQSMGRLIEAIGSYEKAIHFCANYAEAWSNLGSAQRDAGRLAEAGASCRKALELRPDYGEALANLGGVLKDDGQLDEALACCVRAVQVQPDLAVAYNNMGSVLLEKDLAAEAVVAYRQAVTLKPRLAHGHNHLGNALRALDQVEEAAACYRRALEIMPDFPEAMINLGMLARDGGRFAEAMARNERALELRPAYPEAHWNKALMALTMGDFATGWREYEWRWKCKHTVGFRRDFAQPLWDGGSLGGRTLLIHAEQGFGDSLQFIRYAQMIRGGRVVVEVPAELKRLIRRVPGVDRVVGQREELPAFDVHCPMLTLPGAMGTRLESMPPAGAYLAAAGEEAAAWGKRIKALEGPARSRRVGLVWAGFSKHTNDRNRSMKLETLWPLFKLPGVRFFSLQKGEAAAQTKGTPLVDWTGDLGDFAESAALVANLDLVVAVDTAVAHLAGGMGKPVWLLLPWMPEWRWLMEREDTPWYATMQLFRQKTPGDWTGVVADVARQLAAR